MEIQYSAVDRALGYLAAGIFVCILLAAATSAVLLATGF